MTAAIQVVGIVAKLAELSFLLPGFKDSNQSRIAAALGVEILSGALKPGARMPTDAEMTKTFGVSRVVTREVIKTLAAKGLVASKVKVGTIVREPANWNWLDSDVLSWRVAMGMDLSFLKHISEVRRAVEPAAASLAALNGTRSDFARLRDAVAQMADSEADARRFARADLGFHLAVTSASRNPFFQSFAALIETALLTVFAINAEGKPMSRSATTAKHALIVDAIEARDAAAAAKAMLRTVDDGLSRALQNSRTARVRTTTK
jgi:DNA-binding FadR family transcriptional regulator